MVLAYTRAAKQLATGEAKSHEGGKVYEIDKWARLRRFLILGTQGGTFYVSEEKITRENAQVVLDCLAENPERTIAEIGSVSISGIAPKNDPAILALAIAACSTSEKARKLALTSEAVNAVCRTGTHILHFTAYLNDMRGWGRTAKRGVASWYDAKSADQLAFQAVKYRQRDGWSHRDVLRLAHPKTEAFLKNAVYKWIVSGKAEGGEIPAIINAFTVIQDSSFKLDADILDVCATITELNLPREALPTELLANPHVQSALMTHMPPGALIRNLGNMTKSGLIAPGSAAARFVVSRLTDQEYLRRGRVHPMAILLALKTYRSGAGFRGGGQWTPVTTVVDALDAAFYGTFGNVVPTDKTIVLGIDISGSMQNGTVAGTSLTCAEAAVAMAMITANVEPNSLIIGYTSNPVELTISPRQRIDDIMRAVKWMPLGTKCSVPARWAMERRIDADAVLNFTDNDTSDADAYTALLRLREQSGKGTAGVVTTFTPTGHTVYPDHDARVLNVVGFDASVPAVISDFIG